MTYETLVCLKKVPNISARVLETWKPTSKFFTPVTTDECSENAPNLAYVELSCTGFTLRVSNDERKE